MNSFYKRTFKWVFATFRWFGKPYEMRVGSQIAAQMNLRHYRRSVVLRMSLWGTKAHVGVFCRLRSVCVCCGESSS